MNKELLNLLACPFCLSDLYLAVTSTLCCTRCNRAYNAEDGIPIFADPPFDRREYLFEIKRYNQVALSIKNDPKRFKEWGLDETYPDVRVALLKEAIGDIDAYLNIGAGFGQLEEKMPEKFKVCLDQSIEFLRFCQERSIPNLHFVMGFAEKMPFKTNIFPCVASDSVFQTVVDQKEFLIENARILKHEGQFLLATTYKWNYPRKPQLFPADNPELLLHFLKELGIDAQAEYYNLTNQKRRSFGKGDYLLVKGTKNRQFF